MPSLLAINIIKETQLIPPKQDRVIDRDPADADDDRMIIDRESKFTDHNFQFRSLADDSTDVKAEGMLTQENEEGKHRNSSYHHESGELYAEDVEQHMAVRQRLLLTTFKRETPKYRCQNIKRSCDS